MSSATKKQNAFKVLGLTPSATEADIRKAHKDLTKKFHPDKNPGQDTTEKMKAINAARDELLNFESREQAEKDFKESRSKDSSSSSSSSGAGRQNSNSSNSSKNRNSSQGSRNSQDSKTRSERPKVEKDVYVKVRITPRRAKLGGYLTIKVNYAYGPGKATIVVPHSTVDGLTQSYPGWGQMAAGSKEMGSLIVTFIVDPNAKDSGIYFDDFFQDFQRESQNTKNENQNKRQTQDTYESAGHTYNQPYTSQEYSKGALKRIAQVVLAGIVIIWAISSLFSSKDSTGSTSPSSNSVANSPSTSTTDSGGTTSNSVTADGSSDNPPTDPSNSSSGAPSDSAGTADATGSIGNTTDSIPTPDPVITSSGDPGASGGIGA